jgi:hypothetical protein
LSAEKRGSFFENWREKAPRSGFEANLEAYLAKFIYAKSVSREDVPLTHEKLCDDDQSRPTGTISLVAETSSGCEPNFSWAYVRQDTIGTRTYVHTSRQKHGNDG